MGGGSSKEHMETEERRPQLDNPISGLKNGDLVTVRGEAFAGVEKRFQVNFEAGNNRALMFKVILLATEDTYNVVKMNSIINGRWGHEEQKPNVVYLNHYFELKFTCNEDHFSIEVDGNHFHNFKHRISPYEIDRISLMGDANWNSLDINGAVKTLQTRASHGFPTPNEVRLFLHGLRASVPSRPSEDNMEQKKEELSELITKSLQLTKTMLGENKGFWDQIMELGGYLQAVFSVGSALFTFISFLNNLGKESDLSEIKRTLRDIHTELQKIDQSIQQGFDTLVEHMDYSAFRKDVQIPLQKQFDQYIRCQTVDEILPIQEFKKLCMENRPRDILSTMFTFLSTDNNIISTHLKAGKYVYPVFDGWSKVYFNNALQLITVNIFYYAILCAEKAESDDNHVVINEEEEINNLIQQLVRMRDRLREIEANRLKTFMRDGYADLVLREHFKNVKYGRSGSNDRLDDDVLARIVYQMKNSWKGVNGPYDYYMIALCGSEAEDSEFDRRKRYTGWHVADSEKVVFVKKIGQLSNEDYDHLSFALIQPVTKEMRENNVEAYRGQTTQIKEIVEKARHEDYLMPSDTLQIIRPHLSSLPFKPLLILYNTDYVTEQMEEKVQIVPICYSMTSEAWSSPGGPLHPKYYWVNHMLWPKGRRLVQVVFQ